MQVIIEGHSIGEEMLDELLKNQSPPQWEPLDTESVPADVGELLERLATAQIPISLMIDGADFYVSMIISIEGKPHQLKLPPAVADKVGTAMQAVSIKAQTMEIKQIAKADKYNAWTALLALHRLASMASQNGTEAFELLEKVYKETLESKTVISQDMMELLLRKLNESTARLRDEHYKSLEK
jgi:transcriptional regulator